MAVDRDSAPAVYHGSVNSATSAAALLPALAILLTCRPPDRGRDTAAPTGADGRRSSAATPGAARAGGTGAIAPQLAPAAVAGGDRTGASRPAAAPAVGVTPGADVAAMRPRASQTDEVDRYVVLVTDAAALAVVAAAGGSFGALLAGPEHAGASNALLASHSRHGAVVRIVEDELARIARTDPRAGVGIRGHAHRLFDARWLRADAARFELIAVVNRLDRQPFTPGHCGEIRLIYRLGYRRGAASSRLPMTAVAALRGAPATAGCAAAAARWRAPAGLAGAALGSWLLAGPLAAHLEAPALERLEINLQTVRWPSAVRPDLGGHAEYLLRVFRAGARVEDPLLPAPLLDTPDVARIRREPALRARLLSWLRQPDTLAAIDAGTAILPDELSAERVVSVTPRGLARRSNRPYRSLLSPAELADLPLAGRRHIASPEALLRRLDALTCAGCHQSRAIAGFHLLGDDDAAVAPGNALAVARSPHLQSELARRRRLVHALASGQPADLGQPPAERTGDEPGGYGARCGLGDPGFSRWTCAAGLRCMPADAPDDDRAVGVCLPDPRQVGDPCEAGALRPHPDPHRDRIPRPAVLACGPGAVCNRSSVGFPGGMCTESCDSGSPQATCGVIAELRPFNDCLARNQPFADCLARHVNPAGLRACSESAPCRDDYICARTPAGTGACIPPYFLFQLRVDGHP